MVSRPARAAAAARAPPRMRAYDPNEERFAYGFTFFAEKLNGRAAMIGFMIAIGYELLLPEQGGLVKVVLDMMGKGSA